MWETILAYSFLKIQFVLLITDFSTAVIFVGKWRKTPV
jgi:hypothetical protein